MGAHLGWGDDIETLTQVTTGSSASESRCRHVQAPAWKFPSDKGSMQHYKLAAPPPPFTLKHGPLTSSPTALLVNRQSHHSPWKDTRDTWLFHSAGDWLSQSPLPPKPPPRQQLPANHPARCQKTREGLKTQCRMRRYNKATIKEGKSN